MNVVNTYVVVESQKQLNDVIEFYERELGFSLEPKPGMEWKWNVFDVQFPVIAYDDMEGLNHFCFVDEEENYTELKYKDIMKTIPDYNQIKTNFNEIYEQLDLALAIVINDETRNTQAWRDVMTKFENLKTLINKIE